MTIRQQTVNLKMPGKSGQLLNFLQDWTLAAVFLFSFLFSSSVNAETLTEQTYISYVKNPNGMFLYPDYRDKKNRIFVPYQTRLLKFENFIEVKISDGHSQYFYRYELDSRVYYNSDSNNPVIEFRIENTEQFTYPHIRQSLIYSIPFLNAKVITKVSEFAALKILSAGDEWYEVELDGKKGFILKADCVEAEPTDLAEISRKVKKKENKGYFLITSKKPAFYRYRRSEPGPIGDIPEYVTEESGTGKFNETVKSAEMNGIRYYLLLTNSFPFWLGEAERYFWISEKEGKFFTEREYSEYTFAKSKHSRNSELKIVMKPYMDSGINFQDTEFKKFSSAKSVFYFISAGLGVRNYGLKHNFIFLEKFQNRYKVIYDAFRDGAFALDQKLPADMIGDMDRDGFPEFLYGMVTRTGIQKGASFATFKNGKLIPIADIDCSDYEVKGNRLRCFSPDKEKEGKENIKEKISDTEYLFLNNALYLKLSKPTQ